MKFTAVIIAACALFATSFSRPATKLALDNEVNFTLCAGSASVIKVNKLRYEPFPPKINKPLTVIASGDLGTKVTSGAKLVVTARLGQLTVATQVYDICAEAAKSGLNCPISPGLHDLRNTVEFPPGVKVPPFVTINIKAEGFNGDGAALFCFDTTAKFVP